MHFVSYRKELNANDDNIISAVDNLGQYILSTSFSTDCAITEEILPTGDELGRWVTQSFVTQHTVSRLNFEISSASTLQFLHNYIGVPLKKPQEQQKFSSWDVYCNF